MTGEERSTGEAMAIIGKAIKDAFLRIDPRMRKYECAALLEIFASEAENWARDLREGEDGPMGEHGNAA